MISLLLFFTDNLLAQQMLTMTIVLDLTAEGLLGLTEKALLCEILIFREIEYDVCCLVHVHLNV